MAAKYTAPRGTYDMLPTESHAWQHIVRTFQSTVELFNYREIRTPMFEETDLFVRTSGDTSEVVTKQMYTFMDKGDRSMTLKPEGTAPVMRALIEHGMLGQGQINRCWYYLPVFRYERPQKGRCRQHHQVGVELVGSPSPNADAEVIEVASRFYAALGIEGLEVNINCIGRAETRDRFRTALLGYLDSWLKDQDEEGRAKVLKNPLRLFDSKDEKVLELMKGAPTVDQSLEDASKEHFDGVLAALSEAGIPYQVDPHIVRGLDYYTDTVFELLGRNLGAQSTLCGGGRYDNLIKEIGGAPTPSVGFGGGIERLMIVLESLNLIPEPKTLPIYLVAACEEARVPVKNLAQKLRAAGIACVYDLDGRNLKQQFKQADREGAKFTGILGETELANGTVSLKDMSTTEQSELSLESMMEKLVSAH